MPKLKSLLLLLLICGSFILCGCHGPTPIVCPTYDTLRFAIDSSNKNYLVYKGEEKLKFFDTKNKDTVVFNGSEIQHGFDTITIPIEAGPQTYCPQIAISEYYQIEFANPKFANEKFIVKVTPNNDLNSTLFIQKLIVKLPMFNYERRLFRMCNTCYELDSSNFNNMVFYKLYNLYEDEYSYLPFLYWNKEFGVIRFPNGILFNNNLVLDSVN